MKFCKDCKHLVEDDTSHSIGEPWCKKAQDMVNGSYLHARLARMDESMCGKQAGWFEPAKEDWREPRDEHGYRKPE